MRVLQVEDDEATAAAVAFMLQSKGHDCDTVSLGEEAVERAGTKMGNKGWEAAESAIELVNLLKAIK